MKYVKLFSETPEASRLCLGTGVFGSKLPQQDAFAQMDFFFEKGGNFFDTARVYADWIPGGHGASERTLGAWIKARNCRDKVIISTKGAHPGLKAMNISRMAMSELRSDLEESLRTLDTSYIDIYFLHRDDISQPVEEILGNLEILRKEGKIRHYGCSNWTLARMEEADQIAQRLGIPGFSCDQIRFGLADLNAKAISDKTLVPMSREIFAWHEKTGKPVMSYTSSCNGYFSKKLSGLSVSPEQEKVYGPEPNQKILEKLALWEKKSGVPAAVLVSSYVMTQAFPSVPISSFSSLKQLEEVIPAADFVFPAELMTEIRSLKGFLA